MLSEDFLPNVGGITSHIVYLSKALGERGHKVSVLKPSQKERAKFKHEYGFDVIHLKKKQTDCLNKIYIRNQIKNLFEKEEFDILHWHQLIGYETKFLQNVPKVFTNHTSMYLEEYEKVLGRMRLKFMLSHADVIISPSRELKRKSSILYPRFGNYYISNGVDEKKFSTALKSRETKFEFIWKKKNKDKLVILCPRRLEPKCGVKYFIESIPLILQKNDNCYFVVAGCGGFFAEERRLKKYLDEKGVLNQVSFLGDVKNEDMPHLYKLSDIVVFPSLMEATSISCLEAMSSQKAIVSTNVGGLPELIENDVDGFLVEARDPIALAEKILKMANDFKLRGEMGKNARQKVESCFTWNKIAEKTEQVYQNVLDEYL
jgi:glycosyltransferase involved in cell wall biosynthesis